MKITPSALAELNTTFRKEFQDAYSSAPVAFETFTTTVPSGSAQNDYGWMTKLPKMREWLGERMVQSVAASSYTLRNKDWELTVEVDRNDIEDDNLGIYSTLFQEMGMSARQHPQELVASVLEANPTCFDGKAFFADDHPVNPYDSTKGTYDNLRSGTLTAANFEAARLVLAGFKDEGGRVLGLRGTHLVVPPALEITAKRIVGNVFGYDATDKVQVENPYKGLAEVVVLEQLTDANDWYLFDCRRPIKPMIFQNRKALNLVARVSTNDDNVFWQKKFVWGADARYNVGVTLPFLGVKYAN